MPLYNLDARLAAPTRLHTLTPSAEAARDSMREYRRRRADDNLVTVHPKPHAEAVPKSASDLARDAEAAGFEVRYVFGYWALNAGKVNERQAESCRLDAINEAQRVGFQAVWVEGAAKLGLWREPHPDDIGIQEIKARVKAMAP